MVQASELSRYPRNEGRCTDNLVEPAGSSATTVRLQLPTSVGIAYQVYVTYSARLLEGNYSGDVRVFQSYRTIIPRAR